MAELSDERAQLLDAMQALKKRGDSMSTERPYNTAVNDCMRIVRTALAERPGFAEGIEAAAKVNTPPKVTTRMINAAHGVTMRSAGNEIILSAALLERIYIAMENAK